jgi:hypothetical protein
MRPTGSGTNTNKNNQGPRLDRASCPYQSHPQCPRLPDGNQRLKCPFNDISFTHNLGLWCKIPMDADEDELIRRCDVSAGVTRIDLIDRHYATGHVDKATCEEFCRIWDEYKRRMEDY